MFKEYALHLSDNAHENLIVREEIIIFGILSINFHMRSPMQIWGTPMKI